jgi:hypothetical protein
LITTTTTREVRGFVTLYWLDRKKRGGRDERGGGERRGSEEGGVKREE